jgi:hypothetical protein
VTLPQGISGPYYIIVFTNASGATGVHGGNTIVASEVTASTPFPVTLSPAPDLQVTKIITPSQEFSGQPVKATFTITNTGAGPTDVGQWTDEVLLSQDGTLDSTATVVASLAHAGTLAAGQSYTNAATFDLPIGVSGSYTLFVVADEGSNVYELGGEAAHSASVPLQVNLTPPPDLAASVGPLPKGTLTGHSLALSYTVTNAGASTTPNTNWIDDIYLSPQSTISSSAILLGSVDHGGALAAGQSYTQAETYTLPTNLSGPYYVIIDTDAGDSVFELDKTNNVAASASPLNIDFSPVDLTVTNVTAPITGAAGHQLLVSWKVSNSGDSLLQRRAGRGGQYRAGHRPQRDGTRRQWQLYQRGDRQSADQPWRRLFFVCHHRRREYHFRRRHQQQRLRPAKPHRDWLAAAAGLRSDRADHQYGRRYRASHLAGQ